MIHNQMYRTQISRIEISLLLSLIRASCVKQVYWDRKTQRTRMMVENVIRDDAFNDVYSLSNYHSISNSVSRLDHTWIRNKIFQASTTTTTTRTTLNTNATNVGHRNDHSWPIVIEVVHESHEGDHENSPVYRVKNQPQATAWNAQLNGLVV